MALRGYRKVQRKKDFKNVAREMEELEREFSIITRNETCAHNIKRILTFQKQQDFMRKNLSPADYAAWESLNQGRVEEANTFSLDNIKNTLAFPEEIRLQQQSLSLPDFYRWKIDNADKYTLYEQLTGQSL